MENCLKRKRGSVLACALLLSFAHAQSPGAGQIQINAPDVRSSEAVIRAMLKLAGVARTDIIYDLGCGDGRIVIAAAREYGARGVGIDISPQRIQEARANAMKMGVESLVKFEIGDLFSSDIHEASVVTLYLLPDVNLRLRPKLLKELKPGARVLSHDFGMGDWKPDKQQTTDGAHIFLWTLPAK